jgi:hypothetical protein
LHRLQRPVGECFTRWSGDWQALDCCVFLDEHPAGVSCGEFGRPTRAPAYPAFEIRNERKYWKA